MTHLHTNSHMPMSNGSVTVVIELKATRFEYLTKIYSHTRFQDSKR
jgi:hypothetical protein